MDTYLNDQTGELRLSELSIIRVSGTDAISFLNNQFTNDVNLLDQQNWQFNGYCTAKGRLIAIMRVLKDDSDVFIILPKDIGQTLIDRLKVYVFRAKVKFELLNWTIHALINPNADLLPTDQRPARDGTHHFEDRIVINVSNKTDRFLILDKSQSLAYPNAISGEQAELSWRLSEIDESIATIYATSLEKFIPQQLNFDDLAGINYEKGCYPGQEVIARLHYLGKSKQTMQQLNLNTDTPPTPGESIKHPEYHKPLIIVDAVKTAQQNYRCLAVSQFEDEK